MTPHAEWSQDEHGVRCAAAGIVLFEDSIDHWSNAVLRLLGLDEAAGRHWVESCCRRLAQTRAAAGERDVEVVVGCLREAWEDAAAVPATMLPARPPASGRWLAGRVGADRRFSIAEDAGFGWLCGSSSGERIYDPPLQYEEEYFEGGQHGLGYGRYLDQTDWRLEKAARQVRQVQGLARYLGADWSQPKVVDVGSGYGFFRHAAAQAGWEHHGVEISKYAAATAREVFGFDSFVGTIDEALDNGLDAADMVSMWDCLEHTADPDAMLSTAREMLREDGLLFIRTPSLAAVELEVFGADYHSFKTEHLVYFSPGSIAAALERSGFEVAFVTTEAHLLRGFLGTTTETIARLLRGSDLFVIGRRA